MTDSAPKTQKRPYDLYGERFHACKHQLSPRLLKVAHYIHQHRSAVLEKTALGIAIDTQTSDATVIRAIQALGFSGFRDLKIVMAEYLGVQQRSPARVASTVNELAQNAKGSVDFVLDSYRMSCEMLATAANREAIQQAIDLLQQAERVAIFGIGASAILADYTARLFKRNGSASYVLNHTGIALSEQIADMRHGDVLIMMAQKSAHPEGRVTIAEAQRLSIPIILLTAATDSMFAQRADVMIEIPRSRAADKMPVHATPMICLEILVLGLAATAPIATLNSMNKLYEISNALTRPGARKSQTP
ncbi:MurR/RpiR family transcriptional regulator [Pantoea sp.]|uniref:MurR/RpiR family transcriptional regulator n=1 Tax=Pantoea sp. TaxID=69393 RepID=UPI0031D7F7F5